METVKYEHIHVKNAINSITFNEFDVEFKASNGMVVKFIPKNDYDQIDVVLTLMSESFETLDKISNGDLMTFIPVLMKAPGFDDVDLVESNAAEESAETTNQ